MRKTESKSNGVHTASDLARALGVTPQVITAHRRKENAPPVKDVAAWRSFLADVSRHGAIGPTMATKIAAQRLRILKASADEKERQNQIRKGEQVPISEVNRVALAVYSFFFGELDRQRQTWPVLFKGRSELEIFEVIQADSSKIKTGLTARLKEFLK